MRKSLLLSLLIVIATIITGCHSVDDNRIPYSEVHLTFHTVGDWNIYGVKGAAADHRSYIFTRTERIPADFPYTALDRTGYGGLLLVTDVIGELVAYDLACPYEARPSSGPAADKGYSLTRYSVVSGGATEYRVITR